MKRDTIKRKISQCDIMLFELSISKRKMLFFGLQQKIISKYLKYCRPIKILQINPIFKQFDKQKNIKLLFRSQYNIDLQQRIYLTAASISVGFNHVLFDLCISSYYHKSKRTALNVKTRLACTRTHDLIHINASRFTVNTKKKVSCLYV